MTSLTAQAAQSSDVPQSGPPPRLGSWHKPDFIYPDAPPHFNPDQKRLYNSHRRNYEVSSHTWPAKAKDDWFTKLWPHLGFLRNNLYSSHMSSHPVMCQFVKGRGSWAHVVFLKEQYKGGNRFYKSETFQRVLYKEYPGAPSCIESNDWFEEYLTTSDADNRASLPQGPSRNEEREKQIQHQFSKYEYHHGTELALRGK